jgi:ABC-type phosphate transport system permease subunit
MFDSLTYFIYAILALALLCDFVAIVIALAINDRPRLERLLDIHIDVFAACSATVIGILGVFQRSAALRSRSTKALPPKQISDHLL